MIAEVILRHVFFAVKRQKRRHNRMIHAAVQPSLFQIIELPH